MAGRITAAAEPLYLIAITPLLLFPTLLPSLTAAALSGLALLWLVRAVIRRELWPVTPFNAALLVFCLAIPLAVWASPVPELTLPKLTGLILGLAAFRAVAFSARSRRGLAATLLLLGAAGSAIWVLGLLGMRLPALQPVAQRLPAVLVSLPGAEQGVNPNQLAGALVFLLPLLLACAIGLLKSGRAGLAALLGLAALPALASLALTGSRGGWIGCALALAALALALVWLDARPPLKKVLAVAVPVAAILALALLAVVLPAALDSGNAAAPLATTHEVLQQLTLDSRIEIWSRAVYALQDFPFTGVGLGAFRRVVNVLYPLFLVPPDADIAHSHNIFLQVGVDVGLIGLAGYLGLLIVSATVAWQVARATPSFDRYVAVGGLSALLGLHIYGIADALALGSKTSAIFWVVLGLIALLAARSYTSELPDGPVDSIISGGNQPAGGEGPAATPA